MNASVQLHDSDTQAGTNAKHGADYRYSVGHITHPSVNLIANQRVQAGSHGHGKSLSVTNKGQEKTNHNVYNPSVDTPVKQGQVDRVLGALVIGIPI